MTVAPAASPYELPAHAIVPEPELSFHPERQEDRHTHPLSGLVQCGPYSRSILQSFSDPIRLALITPADMEDRVRGLVAEFEQGHRPRERRQYLIDFPGFSKVFGVRAVLAAGVHHRLPADLDEALEKAAKPHLALAEPLSRAITAVQARRNEFDVLLVVLPERWERAFTGGPDEDFDLHDFIKGITASAGIPAQILREKRAFTYFCRCSVMWRLGIAIYCKAGGVPWKLADTDPEAAYIGLSYAIRPDEHGESRFVTCCSQIFDSDGTGLEFIAYDTADAYIERENPYLTRLEMRRVMARSLTIYQQRHGGRSPKRVVIHKSTEFKPDEVDACFDGWQSAESLELVQVQQDVMWRGVHLDLPKVDGKATPGKYPVHRGSYMLMSGREALLWTQGNVPGVAGGDFFKEGKGTPSPLLLKRYAGHGPFYETCRGVLGLSKMDWNNDALYDRLPVTLGYASVLARTIKRMPKLAPRPYQFRLFM